MPKIFSKEDLGKKRVNGAYETPLKTVKYICNKILPHYEEGKKILDPTVGSGIFLQVLNEKEARKEDLFGFDINSDRVETLKDEFSNVKQFDATKPYEKSFDFIVGNPPYNGDESHFVRENRERLKKTFKEIGARNTYSMVAYQAIKALKPGGVFSMILLHSFLTNTYYEDFRRFLLKNTKINELLLAPPTLFREKSADVRTCIFTATKKNFKEAAQPKEKNSVRLVDRVKKEEQYSNPPKAEKINQEDFYKYPENTFLIGIPEQIRKIYIESEKRLGDITVGGTGISTGNDDKFLRKRSEVKDDPDWVPYFKNGARQAYWYEPEYYIEKGYKKYSEEISNYMARNEQYYFRKGVSCSSVGARFSAAYMPPGCLFGVNANFFFEDDETLLYTLGLLNSKLAWYFARKILNRTRNISVNYLRKLPYKEPNKKLKREIAIDVKSIIDQLKKEGESDYSGLQEKLNSKFYQIFNLNQQVIEEIEDFCDNFNDRI